VHWVAVAIGSLAGMVLVGLAFVAPQVHDGSLRLMPRFDLRRWLAELPGHLRWVISFAGLTATLSGWRAMVWGRTLPPRMTSWRARVHALVLGALVHNTAPGHLGALATAWVLSRRARGRVPLGHALASLVVAKVLEFAALLGVTIALAVVAATSRRSALPAAAPLWLGTGAVLLVAFVAVLAGSRRLAPWLAARLSNRTRMPRLAAALVGISAGLEGAGSARRIAAGWALAHLPVLVSVASYAVALRELDVSVYFLGGGLLMGALTLGQLTPGLPAGAVGIHYFLCTSVARSLGAADGPAAALAVLSHTAGVVTHVVVGLVGCLVDREGVRELFRARGAVGAGVTPPATQAGA
jgi:hypothetical protein